MTTVSDCLQQAAGRVARSDARILLAAVLKKPKEFLVAHPEGTLTNEEAALFEEYLERAQVNEPIPYITGLQEFWGRPFYVTPATLIPRPDTETLIEEALAALKKKPNARLLDLGTGSGCIAVTLALECPEAEVWACDKSSEALAVARLNAQKLSASVRFVESNWFSAFEGETFDLIVSNPPYIEEGDEHLSALKYEPVSALASGSDGLDDIRILAQEASRHLRRDGEVIIEHGYNQADSASELFRAAGFASVRTVHDLGGNPRLCCAKLQAGAPT